MIGHEMCVSAWWMFLPPRAGPLLGLVESYKTMHSAFFSKSELLVLACQIWTRDARPGGEGRLSPPRAAVARSSTTRRGTVAMADVSSSFRRSDRETRPTCSPTLHVACSRIERRRG